VEVAGGKGDIDALQESDLSIFVDAKNIIEGHQELPIKIDAPKNITIHPSMTNVTVNFTERTS
ncbi:MAG: hypothetical protein RR603_06640, partial [Kurthia sp.]